VFENKKMDGPTEQLTFVQRLKGCFSVGTLYTMFLALAMLSTGTVNTISK